MKAILGILFACLAVTGFSAVPEQSKTVYVQLILGTDQPCGQITCREIGPKLSKKLSPVFRWKHFWELDRRKVTLQSRQTNRIDLPHDRKLEIIFTRANETEVRLTRRNGLVTKTGYKLDNPMVVLGGENDSRESFFVVVRTDEPTTE
jgi:hypothetical protein